MSFRVFALLIAVALAQVNPVQEGKKHIRSLTFNNFSTIVNQGNQNPWFIMAHSPNCIHCKNFKPDYQKLAFDTRQGETRFAEINCREEATLCKMLRINAYPTLFLINRNRIYFYERKRDVDLITNFLATEWRNARTIVLPDRLPTKMEEAVNTFFDMKNEIIYVFKSDNTVLKVFISIFLVVIAALTLSIFAMLTYCCYGLFGRKEKAD